MLFGRCVLISLVAATLVRIWVSKLAEFSGLYEILLSASCLVFIHFTNSNLQIFSDVRSLAKVKA